MSWIKFETGTPDKPEVWEIAQHLSIDPDAVVGKLLRVWSWFDAHTISDSGNELGNAKGNAPTVTPANAPCVTKRAGKALLDRLVGVTGFCDAMILAGWMLEDCDTITLPNFDRHNGITAKTRALTAKRVSSHKKKGNAPSVTPANAPVTLSALPREEKEKEDISISPSMAPPTLEEVSRECKTKGYSQIDPPAWWGYWDSVGWRTKNGVQIKWQSRLMADNLAPKPEWHTRGRPKGSGSTSNRRNQGAVYDPNITTEQIAESFR